MYRNKHDRKVILSALAGASWLICGPAVAQDTGQSFDRPRGQLERLGTSDSTNRVRDLVEPRYRGDQTPDDGADGTDGADGADAGVADLFIDLEATSSFSMNGYSITNINTPFRAGDVVNKSYVDETLSVTVTSLEEENSVLEKKITELETRMEEACTCCDEKEEEKITDVTVKIVGAYAAYENRLFFYKIRNSRIKDRTTLAWNVKENLDETFTIPTSPGDLFGLAIETPTGDTYWSSAYGKNKGLNPDYERHTGYTKIAGGGIRPDGSFRMGFEDLPGLGDRDFDDVIVEINVNASGADFHNAHFDVDDDGDWVPR